MPRTRPRVVYWDNLPAPYGVERYNALADRGTLDFSVWFSRRTDPDRSWEVDESTWRFSGAYIEDPSRSLEDAHRFVQRCEAMRPDLLLSPYGERPFVVGHAILKALDIRTSLFVQRTFDAWVQRAWWKEIAKAILFRSADAAKTSGPEALQYARRYGFPAERVSIVMQSTNVDRFARGVSSAERCQHRARIGVDGCVFLYVGRLWKGKGLFFLIEAFRRARLVNDAISLLLVGDGVDEHDIRDVARGLDGVVFWPFVQLRELPVYYAAADVFVFPTLGDPHGQVIEEAHAAGLPIITSDAAGDVRLRVVDGTTGFVVPAGDAEALARRMLELAADPDLRASMGARGADRARAWVHEAWADDFERFVSASLALPRRVTMAGRLTGSAGALVVAAADVAARAGRWWNKAATTGTLATVLATIVARANRAGMWFVSIPWRLRRPRERLKRFGTAYGGWVLPVGRLTPCGVCYAIGVGEDASLEDELLRKTDCLVWSFDPTPQSIAHVQKQAFDPARFRFVPVGVWDSIETVRFFQHRNTAYETHSPVNLWETTSYFDAPCSTVAALMRNFKHDALVLLKVDVEGGEWRVLQNILEDAPDVRILCVIFCQPAPFWRVAAMVRRLARNGYRYLCHDEWKFTFLRQASQQQSSPNLTSE